MHRILGSQDPMITMIITMIIITMITMIIIMKSPNKGILLQFRQRHKLLNREWPWPIQVLTVVIFYHDDADNDDHDEDGDDDHDEDDDDDAFHQFLKTLSQSLDLVSIKLCAVHREACLMKIKQYQKKKNWSNYRGLPDRFHILRSQNIISYRIAIFLSPGSHPLPNRMFLYIV